MVEHSPKILASEERATTTIKVEDKLTINEATPPCVLQFRSCTTRRP